MEEARVSETDRRREVSPLESERGRTRIDEKVVAQIAGMAAREVEGVHMGGSASRSAGDLLGSITGSDSQTRGVSAEVGRTETAIDLTLGIDYGRDIIETVEEVRRRISERVQQMTGLRITELNATVTDIVFPDGETAGANRRVLETEPPSPEDRDASPATARTAPEREARAGEEPPGEKTAELGTRRGAGAQRASAEETMEEWRTSRERRAPRRDRGTE